MLDRTQFEFRKRKGTIEAVYVLTECIEKNIRKEKGNVIIVCFADLKTAFDKLKRKVIWERLGEKNVEEKIKRRLEKIYEETYAKIMIEEEIIDELEIIGETRMPNERRLIQCSGSRSRKRNGRSARRMSKNRKGKNKDKCICR